MELRRPVKPLVPVTVWVRFPPSASETGTDSVRRLTLFANVLAGLESVRMGAWCNRQHAGLQNQ